MEAAATNLKSTRRANRCLIALFMVILWLPTLDTLFHLDTSTLPKENRTPAEFPGLQPDIGSLKEYIAGLEAYFNDHFGWRNRLIHWQRRLEIGLFPRSGGNIGTLPGVIVGRDGWLFFDFDRLYDPHRSSEPFSARDLQAWQTLLEHRRDRLRLFGIKYVFVVAPEKQSIYQDKLPDWMDGRRFDAKLEQFLGYMRAHSTVDVVDLRPALRSARRIAPTYFKTDGHWNFFGGFVAYREILNTLSPQMPGWKPLPMTDFELERKLTPSGSLADWAELDVNETCAVFMTPEPGLPHLEMGSGPLEYAEFSTGTTKNPEAKGSAVIFGDSFGNYLAPLLGYHFGKVTCLWQAPLSLKWIEQEKPDLVISEMAERQFNVCDPNGFDIPGDYLMRQYLHESPTNQPPTR